VKTEYRILAILSFFVLHPNFWRLKNFQLLTGFLAKLLPNLLKSLSEEGASTRGQGWLLEFGADAKDPDKSRGKGQEHPSF
jgi:hypothetical protein